MRAAAAENRSRTTCWNVTQVTSIMEKKKKKEFTVHVAEERLCFKSPTFDTAAVKVCQRAGRKKQHGLHALVKMCARINTLRPSNRSFSPANSITRLNRGDMLERLTFGLEKKKKKT